jgi:hypothetical protein
LGHSHTTHFLTFRQEISALAGGEGEVLIAEGGESAIAFVDDLLRALALERGIVSPPPRLATNGTRLDNPRGRGKFCPTFASAAAIKFSSAHVPLAHASFVRIIGRLQLTGASAETSHSFSSGSSDFTMSSSSCELFT